MVYNMKLFGIICCHLHQRRVSGARFRVYCFHTVHSDVLTLLQIWDLESKSVVDELRLPQDQPLGRKAMQHYCVSVSWSADGATLYGGYTDGTIRVWGIGRAL